MIALLVTLLCLAAAVAVAAPLAARYWPTRPSYDEREHAARCAAREDARLIRAADQQVAWIACGDPRGFYGRHHRTLEDRIARLLP